MKISWPASATWILLAANTTAQAVTVHNTRSGVPSEMLAKTPSCAVPCIVRGFNDAGCSLTAVEDCVCTNTTLRAQLSQCVQSSCVYTDQIATAEASHDLCHGYPVPDRQDGAGISPVTFPAIATATVLLRFASRLIVAKKLWWDDWTALIATILFIASATCQILSYRLGLGRHVFDVDPGQVMTVLKLFYVNLILYVVMLSVAKVSICALYARVFVDPKFRRNVRFVLYFFVAHFLLYGGLVSLQCMPVRAAWDRSVNGRCLNLFAIGYTGAATVILEDLVLIAMPIPELMKLQLSLQKKLALGFMLAVGSFATIASMIRLRYLVEVNRSSDVTWDNFDASLWTSIELGATITCGSLPAVLPLLKRLSGPVERVRAGVGRVWHKVSRVAGLPAGTEKTHTPDVAVGLRHRKRHPTGMTIDSVETQTAVDSVSDGSIDYASTKVAQPVHV